MTELERELRELGGAIDFPTSAEIAGSVRRHLPEGTSRVRPRRFALALAVAVLAVGLGLATPQARSAILRFFGVGSVRIEFVDRLPEVRPQARLELGTPIAPADAPFGLLDSELLGEPDRIYRSGNAVTLLYGTPERVRLLVTEIAHTDFTPEVGKKLATGGTRVEFVSVPGSLPGLGLWIEGTPHLVHMPGGPPRLAANTLIWTRGPLTVRLEGAETLEDALRIAESLN